MEMIIGAIFCLGILVGSVIGELAVATLPNDIALLSEQQAYNDFFVQFTQK